MEAALKEQQRKLQAQFDQQLQEQEVAARDREREGGNRLPTFGLASADCLLLLIIFLLAIRTSCRAAGRAAGLLHRIDGLRPLRYF